MSLLPHFYGPALIRLLIVYRSGQPESRPEFTDVIEILQDAMTELPEKTSIRVRIGSRMALIARCELFLQCSAHWPNCCPLFWMFLLYSNWKRSKKMHLIA